MYIALGRDLLVVVVSCLVMSCVLVDVIVVRVDGDDVYLSKYIMFVVRGACACHVH